MLYPERLQVKELLKIRKKVRKTKEKKTVEKAFGSGGIRTHASEETGA